MDHYIQDIINQIKGFINIEFGFCDITGTVLGCSDNQKLKGFDPNVSTVLEMDDDICVLEEYVYQKYYRDGVIDFIVYVKNPNQEAINYINAISICIINLKKITESYATRLNFIKGILRGEVEASEIQSRVKELQLVSNIKRVVFIIKTNKPSRCDIGDIIQSIFPNRNNDFVVKMDEYNNVLIKELSSDNEIDVEKIAAMISDTLNSEIMTKTYIGIGGVFSNIGDLTKSYEQAQAALTVGEIFYPGKYLINFEKLGLGRLVYNIPTDLAKKFLNEIFKGKEEEIADEETIITINKLFENNLHVSEASRQLYLHRNTLIYRLEKIQKYTGLDLKNFDDAVVFRMALLVREYLNHCNK